MKRIVHTVILYTNEEEVFAHASDLSRQTAAEDIALVIVVNKAGDTQLENFRIRLSTLPLEIFIYDPNQNLGYLNGTIYGYNRYCQDTQDVPEWVVVSNTDIEFSNNLFYEDFLQTVYGEDVWCVAPSVYNSKNKSYDNPEYIDRCTTKKIDNLIYIFERPFLAYLYENAAKLKRKLGRNEKNGSQFMYSAKGCFFILRNEIAMILNERKYKALMYSEESYVAELIRKSNKKTYYDSAIEVIHNESTVTSKLKVKERANHYADSLKVIRDEFYK